MVEPHPSTQAPKTENELRSRLESGLLEETHYLDVKRELGAPSRGTNKELGRDLAQFAIDSGALVFGVEEKTDAADELHPIPLHGLAERVEQVARTTVDPALSVRCRPIPSVADPTQGYLWVEVPASTTAPHMVDGTYFGRGDKTRIKLSDPDVQRLHAARAATAEQIDQHLDDYIDRDPVPPLGRKQAHYFSVLMPAAPRAEMLLDALAGADLATGLTGLIRESDLGPLAPQTHPGLHQAVQFGRRSDGAALTTYSLSQTRTVDLGERKGEDLVEIEFTEDGGVRLLHTRLSFEGQPGSQLLFEDLVPELSRQAIAIAAAVARVTNYGGIWLCGVAATGIAGLPAYFNGGSIAMFDEHAVPSDVTMYRRTTTASTFELQNEPWVVAERLCGRYTRMLGISEWNGTTRYLRAPDETA